MNRKYKIILFLLIFIIIILGSIYGIDMYKKHKIVVNSKNQINIIDAEIEKMESNIKENNYEIKKINSEETNDLIKKYGGRTKPYEDSNKTIESNIKKKKEEKLNLLKVIKENE